MNELLQALQILSKNWRAIKAQGGTLDADAIMEEINRVTDRFAGNLQAMGGLDELEDIWIPENSTMACAPKPLSERDWTGSQAEPQVNLYVRVRLADADRTLEWREVEAETLDAAIKVAEQMPDVEACLEASVTPGGVVT